MPHTPGHTNAPYKVYGTNEPYSGMVVEVGGQLYTTQGGALEGNSYQVTATGAPLTEDSDTLPPVIVSNQPTGEDVVTTFVVGDGSTFGNGTYYYSNGLVVPNGTQLHHHTIPPNGRSNIMTQHTMDGNEQDVFLVNPIQTTSTINQNTNNNQPPAALTSGTGNNNMGGGTGGGMGGY
jgi:hypothetical protein